METYEEIIMQAVSQLMIKAMSEQRISDEKVSSLTDELVEISQQVMSAPLDAETRAMLAPLTISEKNRFVILYWRICAGRFGLRHQVSGNSPRLSTGKTVKKQGGKLRNAKRS